MIRILNYNDIENKEIVASPKPTESVADVVAEIIARVKSEGDKALYEYAERFDKVKLASLRVRRSPKAWRLSSRPFWTSSRLPRKTYGNITRSRGARVSRSAATKE
jgi:hypothetical protein